VESFAFVVAVAAVAVVLVGLAQVVAAERSENCWSSLYSPVVVGVPRLVVAVAVVAAAADTFVVAVVVVHSAPAPAVA